MQLIKAILTFFALGVAVSAGAFTVVIDPGHGGKDYGCIGRTANEKTIVLDVARRLGAIIGDEHPEVKVLYTRDDDVFVSLNDRATMANRAGADLFISIHVNSLDRKTRGREKVHGASVYTLGLHRNADNLEVAMRENSAIELEEDYSETYQGFDPSSAESYIMFELTQNRHMQQSVELAGGIQSRLTGAGKRADKGVRQSGFLVLRATSMPAVLVELDFICNPEAEHFLASADGRALMARCMADAFGDYYGKRATTAAAPAAPANAPQSQYIVHLPGAKGAPAETRTFKTLNEARKFKQSVHQTHPKAFIEKKLIP